MDNEEIEVSTPELHITDHSQRRELFARIKELFPEKMFKYGAFKYKPTVPFGNYGRIGIELYRSDDRTRFRVETYLIRICTAEKDFALEDKVIEIFEDMELVWDLDDEAFDYNEQIHCTQFSVQVMA